MRLDGRPLLDTRLDRPFFVDRASLPLARLRRAVSAGYNVLIGGPSGSGKTSLLRQLLYQERSARANDSTTSLEQWLGIVYVNAGDAGTAGDVLDRVFASAGLTETPADQADDPRRRLADFGRRFVAVDTDRGTVLLDDLGGGAGRQLFSALRDDLWLLPVNWVVATRDADWIGRPPADAFFEIKEDLATLSRAEADILLRSRTTSGADEQLLRRVLEQLDRDNESDWYRGTPRRLVDLARRLQVADDPQAEIARVTSFEHRLYEVSRGAAMLAIELRSRGPVSPSDSSLQTSLGVTRPTLIKRFAELEAAGLAVEIPGASEGPGRPKVLYRVVESIDEDRGTGGSGA